MATKAIYQHHERTTTSAVEGDLQLREVGIDPQAKTLIARSEHLSAYLHLLAKESTSPSFDNNLSVGGTLTITGSSTLAALSATTATFSSTLGVTGNLTNTVLAGTGTRLVTSTSTGVLGNATTIAGANEFTALQAFAVGINISGNGTSATATITRTAADGLIIRGVAGSTYDIALLESSGSYLLRNPIGGTVLEFPGSAVNMDGTLTVTGNFTNTRSAAGSDVVALISNSDNTNTASQATLIIASGGTSGGDASLRFTNQSVSWIQGLDNSDGAAYVISEATTLGTSNRLRIASGGAVTIPGTLGVTGVTTLTGAVTASTSLYLTNTSDTNIFRVTSGAGQIALFDSGTLSTDDGFVQVESQDRAYIRLYAAYNEYSADVGVDGTAATLVLTRGGTWGSNGISISSTQVNIYDYLYVGKGLRLDARSRVTSAYSTNSASPSNFSVSDYCYLDYDVNTASNTYVETTGEANGSVLFVWNRNASTGVLYIRGAGAESYVQVDQNYKAIFIYHSTYSGWIRFSHQG